MPGGGGSIAAFLSYNEAKRWSRYQEEFGKGSVEGIAAPEAANNTVASASLIPLLSFGIPGSNSAAVLLGGLLIHGLLPGPRLFEKNADVVLGLYTGSFIATIAQLVIGILILPLCIWLVNRPRPYLAAFIFALVLSGIFTINSSIIDLGIVLFTGLVGYIMLSDQISVPARHPRRGDGPDRGKQLPPFAALVRRRTQHFSRRQYRDRPDGGFGAVCGDIRGARTA